METKDITVDGNVTDNTTPALADALYMRDAGTGTFQKISPDNLLKVINLLTADTAPDRVADYAAVWDNSAADAKKVLLHSLGSYYIPFGAATDSNPLDATAYYFGSFYNLGLGTSATGRKIYIPRAGKIISCELTIYVSGVLGTAETSTVSVRLNDTTDTTVSAVVNLSAATYHILTTFGTPITVAANDFVTLKWVTPSWVTNPTLVSVWGGLLIA